MTEWHVGIVRWPGDTHIEDTWGCQVSEVDYLDQMAHLAEGTCDCHDSWDQCPCAESGHPADMSCGCCPLGTGLCGPRREAK